MLRRGVRALEKVPRAIMQIGHDTQFHFVQHPAVLALSTLVEFDGITQPRAHFQQEQIDKMKEFDPEIARKAQIAFDNDLPINFMDLETIDRDLPKYLAEKKLIDQCRDEVMKRKIGDYGPIPALKGMTYGKKLRDMVFEPPSERDVEDDGTPRLPGWKPPMVPVDASGTKFVEGTVVPPGGWGKPEGWTPEAGLPAPKSPLQMLQEAGDQLKSAKK